MHVVGSAVNAVLKFLEIHSKYKNNEHDWQSNEYIMKGMNKEDEKLE